MSCECYKIGGPWIAEDPSCVIHGAASSGRAERIESIIQEAVDGIISVVDAVNEIEDEYL